MASANLQAQITNLTSQLMQYIGRTTRQSVPTFGGLIGKNIKQINIYKKIRVIIQTLCGGNLNKFNTKDIGSHMRSSIQDLRSHHNLIYNMPNQTQVRQ
ncbi:hypothetical protein TB1_006426 [Malus domestica]